MNLSCRIYERRKKKKAKKKNPKIYVEPESDANSLMDHGEEPESGFEVVKPKFSFSYSATLMQLSCQ